MCVFLGGLECLGLLEFPFLSHCGIGIFGTLIPSFLLGGKNYTSSLLFFILQFRMKGNSLPHISGQQQRYFQLSAQLVNSRGYNIFLECPLLKVSNCRESSLPLLSQNGQMVGKPGDEFERKKYISALFNISVSPSDRF